MYPSPRCRLFCYLLVLCLEAAPNAGAGYPLSHFHSDTYQGNAQVWSAAQDHRGVLYAADAHDGGLLEYDGVTWRRVAVPGWPRTLAAGPDGKVFVGSSSDLGFLEVDDDGRAHFVSLLPEVLPEDRDFTEVAFIVPTSEGVYFVALERLLRWHDGRMDVWKPERPEEILYRLYEVHGRIYVAQWEVGLLRLEGERLELVPGGRAFEDMEINAMFPGPQGEAFIVSESRGAFRYDGRSAVAWELPQALLEVPIQHGARLSDGTLVLVSPAGVVLRLDGQGRLLGSLSEADGLEVGSTYFAYPDRSGAVWLGGEDGLARWEPGAPVEVFGGRQGLPGTIQTMLRHRGRLYVGTSRGVFVSSLDGGSEMAFRRLSQDLPDAWEILPLEGDSAAGPVLLFASTEGVFHLAEGAVTVLMREMSSALYRPEAEPDRLYVGIWNGLVELRREGGAWRSVGSVPGVGEEIVGISEDSRGRLWLSTPGDLTLALELPERGGEAARIFRFEHPGTWRSVSVMGGVLRADSPEGMLRLASETLIDGEDPFVPDPELRAADELVGDGLLGLLANRGLDEFWYVEGGDLKVLDRQADGAYRLRWPVPRRVPQARLSVAYLDPVEREVLWIGGSDGLFRLDTGNDRSWGGVFPPLIRGVVHRGEGEAEGEQLVEEGGMPTLPFSRNAVRFDFAAPSLAPWNPVEYQVRLDGFEEKWSSWSIETRKDYTNLPPGVLSFRVRTRRSAETSPAAVYDFRVLPPWYRTGWAYLGWALAAVLAFLGFAQLRSRRLARDRRRLRRLVQERTGDLEREKAQVETVNARLQEEILQRQRAEEERRKLEEKILQVQKMESLGVLAGGVAHDFNNLLVGILGNADLARMELPEASPAQEMLGDIESASHRAADLCRQMLAYSGKGKFVVAEVDLNELTEECRRLLKLTIPKKVSLALRLAPAVPTCEGDPGQLQQVIMNLVLNGAEAVGDGEGEVRIETGVRRLGRERLEAAYFAAAQRAGSFVFVEVADSGVGMDPETLQRIFEPFFSTKFTGRGLGLAAVLGIVRGHGGAIELESAPGKGTTFRVFLPVSGSAPWPSSEPVHKEAPATVGGAVLLVDDEEIVRSVGALMLQAGGFEAVTAPSGEQALKLFRERGGEFLCVLLDLTMPGMDGEQTFRELRGIDPEVRILMSSGYSEEEMGARFADLEVAGFIQKPYDSQALLDKLAEALG